MRFVTALLALLFVFGSVGPETHACPVHSAPAPASHHQESGRHKSAHCTCPQACCPAGVSASTPTTTAAWTVIARPLVIVDVESPQLPLLLPRKHLLPF